MLALLTLGLGAHEICASRANDATMEEIMEVLKICVAQGIQASNLGVPILAEELAKRQK